MQQITILGSTGSIGQSTLDVIARHPDKYRVFALTANKNLTLLIEQARQCQPDYLVIADRKELPRARGMADDAGLDCQLLAGADALDRVAADERTDTVMAAIVGSAGLLPTMAAVKAGKKVLLANKEALVMSGKLFMDEVQKSRAQLLPIDSEHNAIYQCLPGDFGYGKLEDAGINKILLTGSGGPFLNWNKARLAAVTPEQACCHPNWNMGRKISVDSATMMNKGLEFIEACWLFGARPEQIQVVVHPQSVIHSMVQYRDGSVLAQLGNPDMRTPIAHALAYPQRIDSGVQPLDFSSMTDFSFRLPDYDQYPNLRLAMQACGAGQYATTGLNAANELAVEAFLQGHLSFPQIAAFNEAVLEQLESRPLTSLDAIVEFDAQARAIAGQLLNKMVA